MAKNSITDYDNIAANNTDIQSVDIDEGCAPSGINNAIREIMADLADVNDGTVPLASPDINGGTIDGVTIGSTTAGAGTFTTVTADGLGIGTTSPTDLVHLKEANGTATSTQLLLHNNNTGSGSAGIAFQVTGDGETASYAPKGAILFERTAANGRGAFKFMSDNADDTNPFSAADEVMRIAASGNVGIGTSSPSYAIDTLSSGAIVAQFKRNASGGGSGGIRFGNNDKQFTLYGDNSNGLTIYDGSTERMRIDSSGNLLVNGTVYGGAGLSLAEPDNSGVFSIFSGTGTGFQMRFGNVTNGVVGSITTTTSATSYNTSSDYRLKEDMQPMTGAIERVNALNPVNFAWKSDGSRVDGFLAHEAQAVVPEAVHGTKDAMRDEEYEVTPAVLDEDGNVVTEAVIGTRSVPDYQGIDQSKLVPLLTAALQEAITKIETLETKVAALESA